MRSPPQSLAVAASASWVSKILPWHWIPIRVGMGLMVVSLVCLGADQDNAFFVPQNIAAFLLTPNHHHHVEYTTVYVEGNDMWLCFLIMIPYIVLLVLPWSVVSIGSYLQHTMLDVELVRLLKRYKDNGLTLEARLETVHRTNINTQSKVWLRYSTCPGNKVVKRVQLAHNTMSGNSNSNGFTLEQQALFEQESSIPVMVLVNDEGDTLPCSAVSQAWLNEEIQDRTSSRRRFYLWGGAVYGAVLYSGTSGMWFLANAPLLMFFVGLFVIQIPLVHLYLLHRQAQQIYFLTEAGCVETHCMVEQGGMHPRQAPPPQPQQPQDNQETTKSSTTTTTSPHKQQHQRRRHNPNRPLAV